MSNTSRRACLKSIGLFAALPFIGALALSRSADGHSLRQVRQTSRRTSRRTTRRVVRRRVYTLPARYRTVVRAGTTYYVVGTVYYVKQMEAGKVVYVETTV